MNIYPSDYDDDRPEAPWNDAAQAAADREWSEHLDAIGDPAAERIDEHLDEQDAAADWQPVDADLVEIFGAQVAAALLDVEADAIKERLHALGYDRIPGKPAERVAAYRKLKAAAVATAKGQLD